MRSRAAIVSRGGARCFSSAIGPWRRIDKRRSLIVASIHTCRIALLVTIVSTFTSMLSGCATVGGGAPATTSVQTLEYYPYQVKGYQNSYPRKTILILMSADARDGTGDRAPLNGNPAIGVITDQSGNITQRLYSPPLGPIQQQAIGRAADEAGLSGAAATEVAYKPGVKNTAEYVLESKIRRCWVKKYRGANGQYGPVWRTTADLALDVSIYKPPFSVPFWTGSADALGGGDLPAPGLAQSDARRRHQIPLGADLRSAKDDDRGESPAWRAEVGGLAL